jgi:hypothetical protein
MLMEVGVCVRVRVRVRVYVRAVRRERGESHVDVGFGDEFVDWFG